MQRTPAGQKHDAGCAGGAVGSGRQRCSQATPAEDARSGAGVLHAQQAACNGQHPIAVGCIQLATFASLDLEGGWARHAMRSRLHATHDGVRAARNARQHDGANRAARTIRYQQGPGHAPALRWATRHAVGTLRNYSRRHVTCILWRTRRHATDGLLAGGCCLYCGGGRATACRCAATAAN